jgi:AcrR family transcriptional regulator
MGTHQRREREAAGRREAILDAARTLFWKNGFAGTTMPQIAAAAELAPGTLYLYYGSKTTLYATLLDEGYDLLLARLHAAIPAAGGPRRQAGALIDTFADFARAHPAYFDILFFVLQKEGATRKDTLPREQVRRLLEREQACKAVAAGVLARAGVPPKRQAAAVEAVWSMLAGLLFFFRHEEALGAVAGEARRLLLAGLFPE